MLFLFSSVQAGAQLTGTRHFELEKENKPVKINCFYCDANGYILIGSDNGLFRFNGEKYNSIHFINKDYSDTVTAIFQSVDKKYWIGFKSGRIANIINNKLVFFNPEEGTAQKKITAFTQDREQNIWFATAGEGLYYLQNNHVYLINETDGLGDLHVNTLASASNGDVIAGTDQGMYTCSLQKGKRIISYTGTKEGLPDNLISTIVPIGKDHFLTGMQDKGFCEYDHKLKKIAVPAAVDGWMYGQINAILALNYSTWIATEENGLLKLDHQSNRIDKINLPDAGNSIQSLLQDKQGNVWILTAEKGLVRTHGEAINVSLIPGNPVFEHVHALYCEQNGTVWTNDQNNRIIKIPAPTKGEEYKAISLPGVNEKTDITSIYQDANQHIWIGTMGSGLFVLNPQTLQYRLFAENKLFKNAGILSVSGKGNEIFVSSLQGTMRIEVTDKNKDIKIPYAFYDFDPKSTGTNYIYSIFKDTRNRTWFATDGNGLTVLEGNHFSYYNEKNKLKDDHIFSITEDNNGNIWFSTASAGLYKFDGKAFYNYGLQEGLSDLNISVVKKDQYGNIVIVHKKGLDILDPVSQKIAYINSNQGIGMINSEDLGAVTQDAEGNIMVSSTKGILTYRLPKKALLQPIAIIESIQLYLNDIDDNRPAIYDHDENNFTFNYTGLYYTDPEQVYYQYRLDGLDTNWIITKDHRKNFPKLNPGEYIFRIRASLNKNFNNANEAVYSFEIKKAWYAEWWFMLLCIGLIAGLLFWYMEVREKALKKLERLQQDKIRFQFETLRTQVNPHFLFNSFNTLISTIEEDPKLAVTYAGQLSDFFRDIVQYRERETINLEEEIGLLENYFKLQQNRYGNGLQLTIHIDKEQRTNYRIPPLTLQLLIENAIKHNAISKDNMLQIELEIVNNEKLIVKNNINPRFSKQAGAGMGLQNIINRYNLLSNKKVEITKDNDCFIVSLPLLKKNEV